MQAGLGGAVEQECIRRAQLGDREAFGSLITAYHAGVVNVVFRMCGDESRAEDAAQVAFLNAWQKLPAFRIGTSFRNWLYRIAVNAAVDSLRREKPSLAYDDLPLTDGKQSPESSVEEQERILRVQDAIRSLPEAARAVLVLREYEGLSYAEIAETLKIPLGTVMSRLNYARTTLAKQLQGLVEEQ